LPEELINALDLYRKAHRKLQGFRVGMNGGHSFEEILVLSRSPEKRALQYKSKLKKEQQGMTTEFYLYPPVQKVDKRRLRNGGSLNES